MNTLFTREKLRAARAAAIPAALAVASLAVGIYAAYATSFITASQSVANGSPANDQTDIVTATQANVPGVLAVTTINVGTAPITATSITVGNCVIHFATSTAGTIAGLGTSAEDQSCSPDNSATISTATTTNDVAKTAAQIAFDIKFITNATSTGHGTLALSTTTSTNVVFTSASPEGAGTIIPFTDGTSGKISTTTQTAGTVPVTQISTVTIGGTVEAGDIFTVNVPARNVAYSVIGSNLTTSDIATALNAAVLASSGYSSQAFTTAASTNTVVFTAKVAGTGFTAITSSTTNSTNLVAEKVVFAIANAFSGVTYTVTINGSNYSYTAGSSDSPASVAGALSGALAAASGVTCAASNELVTCTANVAGTGFTYDASASNTPHSSGGGGGGGSSSHTSTSGSSAPAPSSAPAWTVPGITMTSVPHTFTTFLSMGSSNDEVSALQAKLVAEGFLSVSPTGFFGPMTFAALKAYQTAHGISPLGIVGPATRAALNTWSASAGTPAAVSAAAPAPANASAVASISAQIADLLAKVAALKAQMH